MNKALVVGIGLAIAAFVALLVWSSMGLRDHRVEVCITFEGKSTCRIASGASREAALRQATDNACAMLTSGVTGTISCLQAQPDKVTWLEN